MSDVKHLVRIYPDVRALTGVDDIRDMPVLSIHP
jgi:hypothetical protein